MLHFEGMLGLRGLTEAKVSLRQTAPFEQAWQLRNVARYASSFVERQALSGFTPSGIDKTDRSDT